MRHTLNTHCHLCGQIVNQSSSKASSTRPIRVCNICSKRPPEEYRCQGLVQKGTTRERRCKRWVIWGEDRCNMHREQ